jgi:hypothetical protein
MNQVRPIVAVRTTPYHAARDQEQSHPPYTERKRETHEHSCPGARRRRRDASLSADCRSRQAGAGVRKRLPHRRLRAEQPGQLRHFHHLRGGAVQARLAGPPCPGSLGAVVRERRGHDQDAVAALQPRALPRHGRRGRPVPGCGAGAFARPRGGVRRGPCVPHGRAPDGRFPPREEGRRHRGGRRRARGTGFLLRHRLHAGGRPGARVPREAAAAAHAAARSGARLCLDGQLSFPARRAGAGAAGGARAARHRLWPRPAAAAVRASTRLRLRFLREPGAAQQDATGHRPRFNLWNRRWPIRGEHDAALLAKIRGWRAEVAPAGVSAPAAWQAGRTDLRSDERLHSS